MRLTPLAITIAEQIKQVNDTLDSVVMSLRVPQDDQEEEEEQKVREITEDEEEDYIVDVFACGSTI